MDDGWVVRGRDAASQSLGPSFLRERSQVGLGSSGRPAVVEMRQTAGNQAQGCNLPTLSISSFGAAPPA
jgi:hypothetical protein